MLLFFELELFFFPLFFFSIFLFADFLVFLPVDSLLTFLLLVPFSLVLALAAFDFEDFLLALPPLARQCELTFAPSLRA